MIGHFFLLYLNHTTSILHLSCNQFRFCPTQLELEFSMSTTAINMTVYMWGMELIKYHMMILLINIHQPQDPYLNQSRKILERMKL